MRKTVKKTTKRKNLTKSPALPLIRSRDDVSYVLTSDSLKTATGSYKNQVRFADLAIGLRNKLNFTRVLPTNTVLPVVVAGKTGRGLNSWSVSIDQTNGVIQIGCQEFSGQAYRQIRRAVENTGLVTLSV